MSPEILLGQEFDLPTDIFSLGIVFCEIASRKLADDNHFKRTGPTFGIDAEEVQRLANPGCPPAFLALCLDCLAESPSARPSTRIILERLKEIEAEVLLRSESEDLHLGSVKFMTNSRRRGVGPRIPSFGMGVDKHIARTSPSTADKAVEDPSSANESMSDDEAVEAVQNIPVGLEPSGAWIRTANSKRESQLSKAVTTKLS